MKKLLLSLLFFPMFCLADGPRYSYQDPRLNDEVVNLYHDIKYPKIVYGTASTMTVTFLNVSTVSVRQVHFVDGTDQTTAAASTGRVLQIIFSSTTSGTGTTSSTFQAVANIKATITLANAANKVKIWACGAGQNNAAGANQLILTVKRDAADLSSTLGFAATQNAATGQTTHISTLCFVYVDAPGGTGPYVYQAFIKNSDNTTTVSWPNPSAAVMVLEETN